jgi:hypothetical protein
VNASNLHFTITLGGLSGAIGSALLCAYRMGRLLETLDSHIEQCNQIHQLLATQWQGPKHRKRPRVHT